MKYKVTLNNKTYEVEVEAGEAMLVDEYGNRLSKRQHGITIRSLRERGMTAEAILSHLAYAGGLVPERRSYSRDELIRCCDFRKLRKEPIVVKML